MEEGPFPTRKSPHSGKYQKGRFWVQWLAGTLERYNTLRTPGHLVFEKYKKIENNYNPATVKYSHFGNAWDDELF